MKLHHEKIEYVITDERSENDAILIGFFTAVIDNTIKNLRYQQSRKIQTVELETDKHYMNYNADIPSEDLIFDWEYCEHLYLLKAYQHFTAKMKRIFDLHFIKGIPTREIAAMEQVSQRAINSILKRCREEIILCKRLEEHGNEKRDNY